MALNLNEEATLKVKADTGQFNADLKALNDRATELTKALREIEKTGPGKNSDEWRKFKNELDDTRKASEAMRKEVDITTLSYGQLENHVKQLARDLKTLKPGTDEFVAASAKLQTARTYLDTVTASTKNVSNASKQAAKDLTSMANSGLTFGELKTKIEQLKTQLTTLGPETNEFVVASRQLITTQQYYDKINASTKAVSASTKEVTKDLTGISGAQLTFGELKTKIEQLKAKLDTLSPASKEFVQTSRQLQIAEKYYDSVKEAVDGATAAMHKQLLEAKNSDLTYGQLETKVGLLNEQLKKLKPGTDEFVQAAKNLHQAEKDFSQVSLEVDKVRKNGEELAAPTLWGRIKSGISNLSLTAVASFATIGFAIKEALSTAISKFVEFDTAAADMSAVTGIVGEGLDYLKKRAMETGPAVGKSAAEMMDAYKLLASAKPELAKNAEALAMVTDQAIRLSKAGTIDLTQAADLVGESLNQWGQGADKAAEFVDVLAAGSLEGSANMGQMSSSLKYAGTVAAAAGVSFTQTNAILQSLSIISIKGEQAGTGLRNMLVKLQTGAKDTNPAIVGLDKALENLEKKNLSTAQVTKMFGVENLVTAQHVISHRKEIAEMTKNMTGTQVATQQAKTNMATLGETIKQGTATVTNYAVSLGQKLAPALTMAIQYGLAFLKMLAALPQVLVENRGLILGMATGLVAFNGQLIIASAQSLKTAAAEKIRAAAASLASAADKIRAAEAARKAAAEVASTVATEAGTVAENAATVATGRRTISERLQAAQATIMSVIDKGRVIVTNALTIAQNALNAAMKANPYGIIISVVVVLVGALYTLYENNVKVRAAFSGLFSALKEGVSIIVRIGQAIKNLDFSSVANEMSLASTKIAMAFSKGYDDRIASELPKSAKKAGQAAGKALTETHTQTLNTMTEEDAKAQAKREKEAEKARKKEQKAHEQHLEEIRKANEKALELLAKEEAEAHIAGIKDEMLREFAKLQAKRDLEAEDIMRGIQSETIKNQQIANLDLKLQADITRVAGEYAEKKRKKAEEEEKKRLDNQKFIAEQERQAYAALYDWQEMTVQAKLDSQVISSATAAIQLAAIHQRRVDSELAASLAKNAAEEAAERAKAIREATSKEQEGVMLTAIEARFENERIVLTQQAADTKAKIERDLKEKKNAIWSDASNAFSALLKGDLMAFVEHASNIVKGEKEAWQKRIEENMAKYQAVAQMATAAVQFLNQLEQQKAANAIAAAKKERDEKVALIQELIATEKAAQDAAEMEKQRVTQESNDKISAIKSASESAISSLEQQYRQLSSTAEKKKLDEQLQGYKENADGKSEAAKDAAQEAIEAAQDEAKQSIDAAQKAEKEAIKSATNEKNEKIDAAEATRDAEIAAINKRKDIDQATRKQLLADAKAAFETTKEQTEAEAKDKIEKAKDTAKTQTELAKDTQKTKIELAKDQQEAELKAIEAVQKGDEKAAKEILAKAKEDQKEKIRLAKEEADKKIEEAEKEKREKLKKVEQEKQTRIQNQKELNRQIEAENKKAAATEAAAKRKAWEAQKKADIASALITGALATLKALASSFWPANLVFAAMSAVMTGVQVAMIKSQPAPQFARGGFIPQGGRHGSSYGTGGIGLIDRQSGRDVGEMEGGEAIISREQTQANMPLIQRMFANARTPGRRGRSVLSDRDALGQPAGFRDGGLLNPPSWPGRMYLYGGIPGRSKRFDDGGMTDEGYSDNYGGSDNYSGYDDAEARAAADRAEKQGLEQLRLLTAIKDALEKEPETMRQLLMNLENNLRTAMANVAFSQWINDSNNNRSLLIGLETLGTTLSSALTRISTSQTTDSKVIVAELTTLRSSLLLSINEHRSQLVATLGTNRLTNTLAISNLNLQLVSSLKALSTDTTQAVGNLEETTVRELQQLSTDTTRSLSSLEKTTTTELQRHSTNTTKSLSSLEKTTATGLDKLATQSKTDFTQLTDKLQKSQDEATAKTILAMSAASTANQKALASLSMKTVTSLDNLSDEMKTTLLDLKKATVNSLDDLADSTETALALLDKDMTRALALLSQNVTRSLDVLDEDVTGSLDTLNKDQKQALGTLGYRTEQALDRSATRTTQSVDSLSVEVRSLKGSINSVEGAVWQVRGAVDGVQGAVWGSNQAGRLDALIGAISTFGGK